MPCMGSSSGMPQVIRTVKHVLCSVVTDRVSAYKEGKGREETSSLLHVVGT